MYAPSDDSFLLEKYLSLHGGNYFLDMGTGTGIIAIRAASLGARRILAVDINPLASRCALKNLRSSGLTGFVSLVTGDLFSMLREGVLFDVIAFNPPYLVTDQSEYTRGWLEKAWAGGSEGRTIIDRFLESVCGYLKRGGVVYILHPQHGSLRTIKKLRRMGMDVETVAKRNLFFEQLILLSASLKDRSVISKFIPY